MKTKINYLAICILICLPTSASANWGFNESSSTRSNWGFGEYERTPQKSIFVEPEAFEASPTTNNIHEQDFGFNSSQSNISCPTCPNGVCPPQANQTNQTNQSWGAFNSNQPVIIANSGGGSTGNFNYKYSYGYGSNGASNFVYGSNGSQTFNGGSNGVSQSNVQYRIRAFRVLDCPTCPTSSSHIEYRRVPVSVANNLKNSNYSPRWSVQGGDINRHMTDHNAIGQYGTGSNLYEQHDNIHDRVGSGYIQNGQFVSVGGLRQGSSPMFTGANYRSTRGYGILGLRSRAIFPNAFWHRRR